MTGTVIAALGLSHAAVAVLSYALGHRSQIAAAAAQIAQGVGVLAELTREAVAASRAK